jgi:hypothetical protein
MANGDAAVATEKQHITNKVTNTTREGPTAGTLMPGGIERSERQGQQQLVESDTLPRAVLGEDRALYEKLGFTFAGPVPGDDLFVFATLPPGWKKERSGHAMWSHIVDEQGKKRVAIFYKAAFYDRRADANLVSRYQLESSNGVDRWHIHDQKTETTIFQGGYDECKAAIAQKRQGSVLDEWNAP